MTRSPDRSQIAIGDEFTEAEERAILDRVDRLEYILDRQFAVGGVRFGWDAIAGLVPLLGDTLTTGLSAWILWQAHRMGAPGHLKARMIGHVGFDYLLGLVPLVGDLGDAVYKANTRNARLLRRHVEEKHARRRAAGGPRPPTGGR